MAWFSSPKILVGHVWRENQVCDESQSAEGSGSGLEELDATLVDVMCYDMRLDMLRIDTT